MKLNKAMVERSSLSEKKLSESTKENEVSTEDKASLTMDTAVTKEMIRLKGYKYERRCVYNDETLRNNTIYFCKYGN